MNEDSTHESKKKRDLKAEEKPRKLSGGLLAADIAKIFNPVNKKPMSSLSTSSSTSSSSSKPISNEGIFEKAKEIAAKFHGECLSTSFSICKGKNALKFRCLNDHTFFVPADEMTS